MAPNRLARGRRRIGRSIVAGFLALSVPRPSGGAPPPLTPLEEHRYARRSSSAEVAEFLARLAREYPVAEKVTIGTSARGKPVEALLVAEHGSSPGQAAARLTVMLVGSQHGNEPAGGEAILAVAREAAGGRLRHYLRDLNLILIPNANPDGRDSHRRGNGNGVNLSTNFTLLSEPESRAVHGALLRWRPDVVLDVHESAVLKRKSLARQGYLTDFEAQFDTANNPNVDGAILSFSRDRLLPELIARVNAAGLPARHYIGEITDINQPITHGGLSLRNLRNFAAMTGAFSFLVENRLDPSAGEYPTPGNMRVRVAKQELSISAFLACCRLFRADLMRLARRARQAWRQPPNDERILLSAAYVSDPSRPRIALGLRKLDTRAPVERSFAYHGVVASRDPLPVPAAYIVTGHPERVKELMDRHGIRYETPTPRAPVFVTISRILSRTTAPVGERGTPRAEYEIAQRRARYTPRKGDLWIGLDQPARRLIPLLLEPRSSSGVFADPANRPVIAPGEDFFIYRVDRPAGGGAGLRARTPESAPATGLDPRRPGG